MVHLVQKVTAYHFTAAIFNQFLYKEIEWGDTCNFFFVQPDQDYVVALAFDLIGESLTESIGFVPCVDLVTFNGLHLYDSIFSRLCGIGTLHLLIKKTPFYLKAEQDLVTKLLSNQTNSIIDILYVAGPRELRNLRSFLLYNYAISWKIFTILDIAKLFGLGVRNLQLTSSKNLWPPMTVLRNTRLNAAQCHLQWRLDRVVLNETAFHSLYSRLGRLSGDYKLRFGLSPNQTLKFFYFGETHVNLL